MDTGSKSNSSGGDQVITGDDEITRETKEGGRWGGGNIPVANDKSPILVQENP